MDDGALILVLHAHLPWVRHPEHDDFLEEDWLFEAVTETYVPLLLVLERLADAGSPVRVAISVSPTLAEMLGDELLRSRTRRWVESRLELARRLARDRRGSPFEDAAAHAADHLERVRAALVDRWGGRLLPVFRELADRGIVELLTVAATHGVLPLMATDEARRAQLEVARAAHRRHFGREPRGIWLPECAYAPGIDRLLAEAGFRFFFVETHAPGAGDPPARFGPWRPVITPAGPVAFARDPESGRQVWSAESGYPGDPLYREFHRDVGWDLPYEEVQPWLHADGVRRGVGIKLHRVTGPVPLGAKEPYVPAWAAERVGAHADHFLSERAAQIRRLRARTGLPAAVVAPYDAELFGHWWHEGPDFLAAVLERAPARGVPVVDPASFLERAGPLQVVQPAASTWGEGGDLRVWLDEGNAWIYRHLHRAEERMVALAGRLAGAEGLVRRALAQAGRELLLAQASDWAFIMTTGTAVAYAERRTREHLDRFGRLWEQLRSGRIHEAWLADVERRDSLFPDLDPAAWRPRHPAGVAQVWTAGAGADG